MGFNENVWKLCKQIPKGKVTTYKLIADELGNKAYRAVGTAMNKNPYAPKVPCHRVINSNGNVGNFASGTKNKINIYILRGFIIQKTNNLRREVPLKKKLINIRVQR